MRLVGDTSYGAGCAEPGFPGVYGRLADTTLREWIRSIAPNARVDRAGRRHPPAATIPPARSAADAAAAEGTARRTRAIREREIRSRD